MRNLKDYRQLTYDIEEKYFSKYATKSSNTKGRRIEISPSLMRTEFQRDRDRILHSKAFRRLKHKTQVFLAPEGDHYRTRLTHTLEVSQISRSIARALRLNEDLVEAIALGHDLGHTPYGHAGERALNYFTHFAHNEQSLRVVDYLEYDGKGMNLTYEVRDGILNHSGDGRAETPEGRLVAWCDRIAYINHDIDDAIRGGVIKLDDIPQRYRDIFGDKSGKRIDSMVIDMIENSFGKAEIEPSKDFKTEIMGLRAFMFERVYSSSLAKAEEHKAVDMIKFLYEYFYKHQDLLPKELQEMESTPEQKVCDYISTMSDNYAVSIFENITIPKSWSKY